MGYLYKQIHINAKLKVCYKWVCSNLLSHMWLVIALKEWLTISSFKRLITVEQQSRMNKPKGSEQSHTSQQKITAAFTSKICSKSFEQILSKSIIAYNQYGSYKVEI